MTRKIRVVIADDHSAVRSGIRSLLKPAEDIEVVAEAADGVETMRMVTKHQPDLLLLDMDMPGLNGTQVIEHLSKNSQPPRILVLSAYTDEEYIRSLLKTGVQGYLAKDEAPLGIITAVREVSRGRRGWIRYC